MLVWADDIYFNRDSQEGDMQFYGVLFFFFEHTNAFAYLSVVVWYFWSLFISSMFCKFQKSDLRRT